MSRSMYNGATYQAGDCTYTNEARAHDALLPERFQSTSTPHLMSGDAVEDGPLMPEQSTAE